MSTTLQWLKEHTTIVTIAGREKCCANCEHFMQHYIRDPGNGMFVREYVPIFMGHCPFPRLKNRRANEKCEHFRPRNKENTP